MKGKKIEMFRAVDEKVVRGMISETQGVFLRHISLSETLMDEGEYIAWSEAVPELHELFKLASTCALSGPSAPLHREIERLQALSAEWTELVRDDDRLV